MKRKNDYHILLASLFVSLIFFSTGCTGDLLSDSNEISEGLVLQLGVNGEPVSSEKSRTAPSDSDLNENVVKKIYVFFFQDGKLIYKYLDKEIVNGAVILESGNWKEKFNGSYEVYVLANMHSFDNPLTSEIETDLEWISDKSNLEILKDTDIDIVRVKGEDNGAYTEKYFMMDGCEPDWNANNQENKAVINVKLTRAAAKLKVNLKYTDDFLQQENQTYNIYNVTKKLVRYTQDVRALSDANPLEVVELPVYGDSGSDGFTPTNYWNQASGTEREDILYAYTYPNDWGDAIADRETYFLVNVMYTVEGDANAKVYNNYYKVPVRVSNDKRLLRLQRNYLYEVNVTIDRKGNESVIEATELTPTFSVKEWKPTEVPVNQDSPQYLMVSDKSIEMYNVEDTVVSYFSSSNITVEVTGAYYVDKEGNEISILPPSSYSEVYAPKITVEGGLNGELKIHSEMPPLGETDPTKTIPFSITPRYITVKVSNDDGRSENIEIIQYPLEYISGAPGWYSGRLDFDATWADRDNVQGNVKVKNEYFNSRVYNSSVKRIYNYVPYGSKLVEDTYNVDYENQNNRMYVVQITSTSGEHIIARPNLVQDTDGILITDGSDENNELVSPTFMLASQLGIVRNGTAFDYAKEHCKYYIEVVKFPDGNTKVFYDWRLPTEAEFLVIADYQLKYPQILDKVLIFGKYWAANGQEITVPSVTSYYSGGVRCIRDVTPEDLKLLREKGVK